MFFSFTKIASIFLMPPLNLLVVSGIGFLLLKSRPRFARALLIASWLLLYVFSMPFIVGAVRRGAETTPALEPTAPLPPADAIVILAGGIYVNAPEYGGDTVDGYVLERLRYAVHLYRRTGKPILVTGGSTHRDTTPESQVMKESLEQDFQVPVRWIEAQSRTTQENASFSAALLRNQGVHTIYLVTHALHMPRARQAFEQEGFQVVPAPTMFATSRKRQRIQSFLPHSGSLNSTATLFHEGVGRLWYFFAGNVLWGNGGAA
jgi:uncharacterized SAM-binding protein YcdF (DUF218 family)